MHLLIAAAGSGKRMGANCNKLLLQLAGRPLLAWTLEAALSAKQVSWIGIVGQENDRIEIMNLAKGSHKPIKWIQGGSTRQESVRLGLAALPDEAKHVLIHDGARCLIDPKLFNRCSELVQSGNAVIAATPVTDTIKIVDCDEFITRTPNRSQLWAAQTPQGFAIEQLQKAHATAELQDWNVTDDAALYERLGWPVKVLLSEPSNIKVTTPFDLIVAEAVIASRAKY